MTKTSRKYYLTQGFISAVFMVVLGLLLLVKPDFGSAAVGLIVGWGLIILCAISLIANLRTYPMFEASILLWSILGLIGGIYLVKNPLSLASLLGTGLGIFLLIQGLSALSEARLKRFVPRFYIGPLILGLVMLIFGIVLLIAPLSASQLIMSIAGVVLIICGGSKLLLRMDYVRLTGPKPKAKSNIIDADE